MQNYAANAWEYSTRDHEQQRTRDSTNSSSEYVITFMHATQLLLAPPLDDRVAYHSAIVPPGNRKTAFSGLSALTFSRFLMYAAADSAGFMTPDALRVASSMVLITSLAMSVETRPGLMTKSAA